jgi:hypothetical protein
VTGPVAPVGPDDLALAAALQAATSTVHLRVRNSRTGQWSFAAACGSAAWTQTELDAQLTHPPRLAGISAEHRCALDYCRALWPIYDRGR